MATLIWTSFRTKPSTMKKHTALKSRSLVWKNSPWQSERTPFTFDADEEILTEYSHKYSIEGFAKLARPHGFSLHKQWTDSEGLFGVLHLVVENVR